MPYGQNAQDALLKWVNNGFHIANAAKSLNDLSDGIVLSQVLQDIDPTYDASDIDQSPSSSTSRWLAKRNNLRAIHRALFRYIHHASPDLDVLSRTANFAEIADNPDAPGMAKLVSVFMAVAFLGPDPGKYVGRLQEGDRFDNATKFEIQQIIMEKEGEIVRARESVGTDDAVDQAMGMRDAELVAEEKVASLTAQLETAKKKHADTITRLEHLQDSYETLKMQEGQVQRELEVLRRATRDGATDSQIIKSLEDKIKEQDELIANQEAQAEDDRIARNRFQKEVATLAQKSERAEQLDDELKELRHRNDELSRKANAAERFKQKLEQQQHLVKEVQNLQFEKEQLTENLRDYERIMAKNQALEKTLAEVRSSHAAAEEMVFDLNTQKKALEQDLRALYQEMSLLQERKNYDERVINELQDQLTSGATSAVASPGATATTFSLDQELNESLGESIPQPNLALEIGRLKAENSLLRKGMGSSGENSQLRQDLEEEQRKCKELQDKYNDVFERHAVAQDQINALIDNVSGEGGQAFANLRNQLIQANFDLEQEKQRARDLESRMADRDRDLLSARTDLSAVEKGSVEALEELKATDTLISESLRAELDAARARMKILTAEVDEQKTQLIKAYVEKDKYRKELDDIRDLHDKMANSNVTDGEIAEVVKKSSEKIEKLRTRLRERQEQTEQALQEKHELQKKLKAAQEGSVSAAYKAESERTIKNLQRENALMSTAWYDLTSRLQSNHVVLQRRNDMPKSWLNKQRQLVNATPRR